MFFFFSSFKQRTSCLRKQTNLIKAIRLEWKCSHCSAYATISRSGLITAIVLTHFFSVPGEEERRKKNHHHALFFLSFRFKVRYVQRANVALNIKGKKERESELCIIYFKARVYLLRTNCSRGSALEGCALLREGGGPRGHKRACLSIRLYQKNTAVATALKIRDGCGGVWW